MSILIDAGVLAAPRLPRDRHRHEAELAMARAVQGHWGTCVITDYLFDEAVTLARTRTHSHAIADELAAFLLGEPPHPRKFALLPVHASLFAEARRVFHAYADRELSFTDCTSIAVLREHGLDAILSFDRGFDGLVRRIDPADDASLAPAP